jgi:hypothetical protein
MKTISKVVAIVSSLVILTTIILILAKPEVEFDTTFCTSDDQCVRQSSCCDCGLGIYVNEKYYEHQICDEQCECASEPSRGLCIENTCTAVTLDQFCDQRKPNEQWDVNGESCLCLGGEVVCGTEEQRAVRQEAKTNLDTYYQNIVKNMHNRCRLYDERCAWMLRLFPTMCFSNI